jgi:hypothetical protein
MPSVKLLPKKVSNIIQNKEALNNKTHITQSKGFFFFMQLLLQKGFEAQ